MNRLQTTLLLLVILTIPPGVIGYLYWSVKTTEAAGLARWEGVDPETLAMPQAAIAIAEGKMIYDQSCTICHGKDGTGGLGKPLNIPDFRGEAGFRHIVSTLVRGVPGTPMASWKAQLSPEEAAAVAVYVQSLKPSASAESAK